MNVQVKSSNGISLVPMETRLLARRMVFVEGEIDAESSCNFVKEILLLNQEDTSAAIDVMINTPGGEINPGMLMYDAIQSSIAPIRMICLGKAYSMGAVLFASGKNGRFMLPHGELMIHEPVLDGITRGNSASIRSMSDSLLQTKKRMNQILAKHTGRSLQEVEKATAYDHYYSPEESIAFGLCDGIIGLKDVLKV